MATVEFTLTVTLPDDVDRERIFDAVADLVHEGDIPGVEVFCSGQGQTMNVHVFVDDEYDPDWNAVES